MKNTKQDNKLRSVIKSILIKENKIIKEAELTEDILDSIINTLKENNVDGEDMQYILEQVGMQDQMLYQLVNTLPYGQVRNAFNEREENEGNPSINENEEPDYSSKWGSMDYEDKEDILLSALKDPDDVQKYLDFSWDDLPSYITQNIDMSLIKETNEAKKEDKEEDVDPDVKDVQDALTQAAAAANKLNDPKLIDQIGNTITYMVRAHIVGKSQKTESMFKLYDKIK